MRKKIIPILFVVIFLIGTLMPIKTNAIEWQENYNVNLSYEIKDVNGKKQVVIPVYIENIGVKGGILTCKTKIEYDEKVFENIEIKGTEKWEDIYVKDNKVFASKGIKYSAEKQETPFVIYLTVKKGAITSNTEVSIKNLSVGNAVNEEKAKINYTIKIKLNNLDVIMKVLSIIAVIAIIAIAVIVYIFIIKPKLNKKENTYENINTDENTNEDNNIE